jgi:Ca2+-binding RTX toxin-like protein
VNRNGLRLAIAVAALAVASLLALPGSAAAFQTVRIEGGTLFITGDAGKTTDEVTIRFDSVKNEFVIGHDVDMITPPPGCTFEGGGPPYKILHCPAPGITRIRVDLGTEKDKVSFDNIIDKGIAPYAGPKPMSDTYLPIDLVSVEIFTGAGNDKVDLAEEEITEEDLIAAFAAAGINPATQTINTGTDVDTVTVETGQNTIDMEGSAKLNLLGGINDVDIALGGSRLQVTGGLNDVRVGPGNSKADLGGLSNTLVFGPGASSVTAVSGENNVTFGPGNSVFSGGSGIDMAIFGPGNNSFAGGGGNDSVILGAGKDSASGGPGKDTIRGGKGKDTARGGPGNDSLFGGPAFDSLFGGPGKDACAPGGPGVEFQCEVFGTFSP